MSTQGIDPAKNKMPETRIHGYLVGVLWDISEGEQGIVGDESVYWIEADDEYDAARKARKIGEDEERIINHGILNPNIRFIGITEVMPVWEKPVHGAQLGWRKLEFPNRAAMREAVLDLEAPNEVRPEQKDPPE